MMTPFVLPTNLDTYASRVFRIASLPSNSGRNGNPYVDLFYRALRAHGVECVGEFRLGGRWLLANWHEFDAIHFHWPEYIWGGMAESLFQRLHSVAALWR